MSTTSSETQLISLPDIILLHVMKYLDAVDLVSFSAAVRLSSVSSFLKRARCVGLGRRFNLKVSDFELFGLECNIPQEIRVLDISHCYWIPVGILLKVITNMSALETLDVEGTQLSLIHLSELLRHCQNIKQLSFTLHTDLHEVTDCSLDPAIIGKIIRLKIVWFDYADGWRLALQFLGFCRDCCHLHLVPNYQHCDISPDDLASIENEFLPKLKWMDNLDSFICFQKTSVLSHDPVMESFSLWMSNKLRFSKIQRFWLGPNIDQSVRVPKSIDSWHAGQWAENASLIGGYESLTEIGGVELDLMPCLPNLRLAQGTISDDDGLFGFLQRQPKLEHLLVEKDADLYTDSWMEAPQDFKMTHLRSLVYTCCRLDSGLMGKLIDMSPYLELVSLDCTDPFHWSPLPIEQLSKLDRLKRLSIEGDGFGPPNAFQQIFTHCRRLELLSVRRKMSYDSLALMQSLVTALPLAENLRDLSLSWAGDTNLKLLSQIATVASKSSRLERLHLELRGAVNDHKGGEHLPEIFAQMIQLLPRLVALAVYFDGPSRAVKELRSEIQFLVNQAVKNVLVDRPSFCFLCNRFDGSSHKYCHYDELIESCPQSPISYFA